jgi:hypothetical protein
MAMPDALTLIAIAAVMLLALAGLYLRHHYLAVRAPETEDTYEGATAWWSPTEELARLPARPFPGAPTPGRHRLAWVSARNRAAAYHEEMEDAREERDILRALVRDLSSDMDQVLAERDEARQALREAGQRLAAVRDGT